MDEFLRVLLLQDYNTRIVVLGAASLGCAAGVVGSFTLLRKRALMGDAISHATLPGLALAFILSTWLGFDGKSLPLLMLGATLSGLTGVGAILILRNTTRLKEDAALGIVLSVFFGAGVALLSIVQQMDGHAAGLESYIFGKTASMGRTDATLIIVSAFVCIATCFCLRKELTLLCFDDGFAGSRGLPVILLDFVLMAAVILVSIVGLQAVGLVLMVALLIIPAAAARFWTEELPRMMLIAAFLGGMCGLVGATASALFPSLPSGAMIVLACAAAFGCSFLFGRRRGVVVRQWRRLRLNRAVARQHVLRALFELQEGRVENHVEWKEMLDQRSWSKGSLRRTLDAARRDGLVTEWQGNFQLTKKGMIEAERLTREHRLWELYLITHADVAPARVDRQADRIEHVLEPETVTELRAMLDAEDALLPPNPHQMRDAAVPFDQRETQ